MGQCSSHTPPLGPTAGTLLLQLAQHCPTLGSSAILVTCPTAPPRGPFLAGDDRKRQNLTGEKGSLQLAMYPMTPRVTAVLCLQE